MPETSRNQMWSSCPQCVISSPELNVLVYIHFNRLNLPALHMPKLIQKVHARKELPSIFLPRHHVRNGLRHLIPQTFNLLIYRASSHSGCISRNLCSHCVQYSCGLCTTYAAAIIFSFRCRIISGRLFAFSSQGTEP